MTWTHTFRFKKGGVAYLAGTAHPDLLCSQWSCSGLRQMVWCSYSEEVLAIVKIVASVWLHSMSHCAWKTLKNSWNAFLLVLFQYISLVPFSWHWITLLPNTMSCEIENILSRCLKSCGWKLPSRFLVCVFPEGMGEIKHRAASAFETCMVAVRVTLNLYKLRFACMSKHCTLTRWRVQVCDPACSL